MIVYIGINNAVSKTSGQVYLLVSSTEDINYKYATNLQRDCVQSSDVE